MSQKKYSAFTLVELLVAMAIISVLIGLAIGAISVAQRVSRDSQRRGALQEISAYLGEYAASNQGRFPQRGGAAGLRLNGNDMLVGTGAAQKTIVLNGSAGAAASTNSNQTRYCYYSSANVATVEGYVLAAQMEDGVWDFSLSTDKVEVAAAGGATATNRCNTTHTVQ